MPRTNAAALTRQLFSFADVKTADVAERNVGVYEGYMSVFGNVDLGNDIVEPGAFTKTLQELKAKQLKRANLDAPSGRYLLPIVWNHDTDICIGGVVEAHEDSHGLYVKCELDLNVDQGHAAYSGLKMGYIPGMSFAYLPIKYSYDAQGHRHLKEVAVLECTVTPFPMNEEALAMQVKSACGDTGLPLADRDDAWDGAKAHKQAVDWATNADGSLDAAKMQRVHFWYDESAPDKITSYKLGFAYIENGKPVAVPRGIFAVAAVLQGSQGGADLSGDTDAVKAKVASYYKKMASQFDDTSLVAPWAADSGKGMQMPTDEQRQHARKARDFDTLFQSLAQADDLQDEWGDTFIAFTHAMSELMYQAQAQTNGWLSPDMPQIDVQEAAQANLDAFSKQVLDLVTRSAAAAFAPCLDYDGDQFLDPDGVNADEGDDAMTGYMSDGRARQAKAGRVMSSANHSAMGSALDEMGKAITAVKAQHKALTDMHAQMAPKADAASDDEPSATDTQDAAGSTGKGGKSAATPRPGAGAGAGSHIPLDSSATPQGNTSNDDDDDEKARLMALKIQMRLQDMKLRKGAA